jgi:hypothetical protein
MIAKINLIMHMNVQQMSFIGILLAGQSGFNKRLLKMIIIAPINDSFSQLYRKLFSDQSFQNPLVATLVSVPC